MEGWIKLHRKILLNPLWSAEPFTKGQAWVDILLNVNHDDNYFYVRGNKVDVKRGQLAWSEVTMSSRWHWSRQKVRRFLKLLEKEQQIEQQKSTVTTIITIKNFEQYQSKKTADDTAERQQKDSRRYTNNNVKNDKNVKNIANAIEKPVSQRNPDIDDLTSYFLKVFQLPKEDCSIKQSRQYWSLLLKESRTGVEGVRWLIDLARKDPFWAINITSSKDLYYKRVKVISRTRKSGLKIAVMGGESK